MGRIETSAWVGFGAEFIDDAPLTRRRTRRRGLWVVGDIAREGLRVGVVGARAADREQRRATQQLCGELAAAGAIVVSGGAEGVDEEAHRAALDAGGATWVCLPAGVGHGGTVRQRDLSTAALRGGGAVLSCEKPENGHQRGGYRRRNAVIVSLIDALIVVCGGRSSGTLITARMAEKHDVPRRAIPWNIGSLNSDGSNDLLARGWSALARLDDGQAVLAALVDDNNIDAVAIGWQRYAPLAPRQPSPLRGPVGADPQLIDAIDQALRGRPKVGCSLEELVAAVCRERSQVAPLLLQLRMSGQIQQAAFGRYIRRG